MVVLLCHFDMVTPAHSATAGYARCSTHLCIIQHCDVVTSPSEEHCLIKLVHLEYNEE